MSLSRKRSDEHAPKVEINIIPLVDVSLVLLIIFMVTATFVKASGLRVELPHAASAQHPPQTPREITIEVAADGVFSCLGAPVSDVQLQRILADKAQEYGQETRVTIRGDRRAALGRVVQAMSAAQEAGLLHLVVATEQPQGGEHASP
jgi:biopolymer transport protein ExbD